MKLFITILFIAIFAAKKGQRKKDRDREIAEKGTKLLTIASRASEEDFLEEAKTSAKHQSNIFSKKML